MRNFLLAAALSITAVAGCSKPDKTVSAPAADKAEDKLPSMTIDEVENALATNQAKAVDCNGQDTRKKMGVVPSAILVTDDESYAASELPADKTAKLVFYCADPGWHACHVGAVRAKSFGYTNVAIMPEGIFGWVKAGKKTQQI